MPGSIPGTEYSGISPVPPGLLAPVPVQQLVELRPNTHQQGHRLSEFAYYRWFAVKTPPSVLAPSLTSLWCKKSPPSGFSVSEFQNFSFSPQRLSRPSPVSHSRLLGVKRFFVRLLGSGAADVKKFNRRSSSRAEARTCLGQ